MPNTIGFIGLGLMGKPMALNLLKKGFAVVVHSRSRGPVDELVAAKDNAFVLINGGDALTVDFDASLLPPTPAGCERQLFLWSVGWDKDADYYTVLGDQLEPWPWHGMDDQEYGEQPRPVFPTDALMKKYTTRWVGPWVPVRKEVAIR